MIEQSVVVTHPRPGACVLEFYGDHDMTTAGRRERQLSEALALNDLVVVDVSGAEFVDSSFLHNLLVADQTAKERKKVFRLQMGTAHSVRIALEVAGLLEYLDCAGSREEALSRAWSA